MPDAMGFQTLDEMAREGVKAGKIKAQPSTEQVLHNQEEDALARVSPEVLKMDPVERISAMRRPTGDFTTGQEIWDANGGRSPFPDPVERVSGGRYRCAQDESGNVMNGIVEEVATGKFLSLETVTDRIQAEKMLAAAGMEPAAQ